MDKNSKDIKASHVYGIVLAGFLVILAGTTPYGTIVQDNVAGAVPVYEIATVTEPVYTTIEHKDPIYETLHNYVLIDAGMIDHREYEVSNVYDISYEKSGADFWGNPEYTVVASYYESTPNGRRLQATYYMIEEVSSEPVVAVVGFNEWSEEVITKYRTYNKRVVDHYVVTKSLWERWQA